MISTSACRLMTGTALACVWLATAVNAQTPEPPAETASDPVEVTVTAQKKPEPLSRAPIAMSVVSGRQMEKAGAHDLKDIQTLTPSLLITSTANEAQTTARLRGVGTVGDNPGLDSSVGVVVDGVSRARTATAMSDLGVLDRIEVLKGPQSDIYGKGASAGVIQVVSKLPSFTPSQSYELTAGEQGTFGASAYVTGGLSQHWAGSLFATKRQRDGQYTVHTGDGPRTRTDDGNQNYGSVRSQLLYDGDGWSRLRIIADYTKRDESCCVGTAIAIGGTRGYIDSLASDAGTASVVDPKGREAWSNRPTDQVIVDSGLSAQWDLRLANNVQLTSITAYRHWDHTNGYDADFSSADIYYRDPNGGFGNRFDTWSQEVRLNGKTAHYEWMLGAYANQEDLVRHDETLYGRDYEAYLGLLLTAGANRNRVSELTGLPVGQSFVPGQGNHDTYRQRERNMALFGHAEWFLTDTVSLLGGLRYNHQTKDLTSAYTNSDNGIACARATGSRSTICQPWSNPAFNALTVSQKNAEDATTGSLKMKWQATPTVMAYASYATGWKGAGFNLDREQMADLSADRDTSFKAETSRSYEIGLKGRFLSRRLALDVAAFDEQFHNFQLNTFLGTNFVVNSVPHLRSKGVEVESRYVAGGLILNGGITYDDARFGPDAVPGVPLVANGRASFAPKWSAAYGLDYTHGLGNYRFNASFSAKYNSDYNTGSDLAPIKRQTAFTLYNGRLAISDPDEHWSVELWGQNLTDEVYYQVAFSAPFQAGSYKAFLGQPRTVGLTLRLRR
ncbi:TonB-dependent receptor [Asticcacaulis sp. 201]|uniref:TonB-dependent receptor n=1 Tax=Asticcacaulis sp. 201 TaxID=3028787 RepID=UPI0029160842|nr:TonB-dependent receptor [Asticcacaulis sp. 201]MDV6331410.1 TonB-dependent receptor [Asticcacaulis sp. 201]